MFSYLTNGSDPFRVQWKGNPLTAKNLNQLLHLLCGQENYFIVIGRKEVSYYLKLTLNFGLWCKLTSAVLVLCKVYPEGSTEKNSFLLHSPIGKSSFTILLHWHKEFSFLISKGHSTVNSARKYAPELVNTFCETQNFTKNFELATQKFWSF